MIYVTIYENEHKINAFKIKGHANSAPYGKDLVCAAVSAVSFGAVNAASKLTQVELIIDQVGEGGYLYVEIPPATPDKVKENARFIFEAMVISLQTIERDYGSFIKIIKQ